MGSAMMRGEPPSGYEQKHGEFEQILSGVSTLSARSEAAFFHEPPDSGRLKCANGFFDDLGQEGKVPVDITRQLAKVFKHLAAESDEQFLPTPIQVIPTGRECGQYLALDIGGSNLRVALIELREELGSLERSHERSWPIEDGLKMADHTNGLFVWIGQCLAEVVEESLDIFKDVDEVPIGVTFSFPMIQRSFYSATVMSMGKGFDISRDSDLGQLLLAGYQTATTATSTRSQSLPTIKVIAIANDAVATLISLSYQVRPLPTGKVALAVILGTGTNAAVQWQVRDLQQSKQYQVQNYPPTSPTSPASPTVLLNTEWGIRGTAHPLQQSTLCTKWDQEIDHESEKPGFQPFEYMTSGRYLGEICRRVIRTRLTQGYDFADADLPTALRTRFALTTKFCGMTIAAASDASALAAQLDTHLPFARQCPWPVEAARALHATVWLVTERSALFVACAIVGLLIAREELATGAFVNRANADECVVACAGALMASYPGYLCRCQRWVDLILGKIAQREQGRMEENGPYSAPNGLRNGELAGERGHRKVVLKIDVDGGVVGAGVLAAMASTDLA